jgi:Flp pilus assembly protein TadG
VPRKSRALRTVNSESGQSVAELALATPLLLLLVLGGIEMGRLFYMSVEVHNATRSGVQYGAQNPVTASDSAGMQNAALKDAPNIPGLSAIATHYCQCVNGASSTCAIGDCTGSRMLIFVKVDTTAQFRPLFSYPGIPSSFPVRGEAIMRVPQ